MGFNSLFVNRIDYQDRLNRLKNLGMEMVWKPKSSLNDEASIFTHELYRHYTYPPGFSFDYRYNKENVCANPETNGFNVDNYAKMLTDYF